MSVLQYTAVNKAMEQHPRGIDLSTIEKSCVCGTDVPNAGYTIACGCAHEKGDSAELTSESMSYGLGLILGGCGGLSGQVVIDNVAYGFY